MPWWIWLIFIIVLIGAMFIGFVFKTSTLIRNTILGGRFDDDNTLHYFTKDDFEGLNMESFTFKSNDYNLMGYLYSTDSEEKGIIVFAHGIGAGHIQYTTEINYYAQKGYRVYAFDAQGCLASEGNGIDYFSNYVKNLDDFLTYLESLEALKDKKYILIGHSLGGYGVNLMIRYHKEQILKIISLSGFYDVKTLLNGVLGMTNILGISTMMTKIMVNQDKKHLGTHSLSIEDVINEIEVPMLFVSGSEDTLVRTSINYERIKLLCENKDNFKFLLVGKREHRPLLTVEAAEYDEKRTIDFNNLKVQYKNKIPDAILKSYYDNLDYNLLVQLDDEVMHVLDQFLEDKPLDRETLISIGEVNEEA